MNVNPKNKNTSSFLESLKNINNKENEFFFDKNSKTYRVAKKVGGLDSIRLMFGVLKSHKNLKKFQMQKYSL